MGYEHVALIDAAIDRTEALEHGYRSLTDAPYIVGDRLSETRPTRAIRSVGA